MTAIILYDDSSHHLAPATDLRPAFDVRTGVHTTLERHQQHAQARNLGSITGIFCPQALEAITRETHAELAVNDPAVLAEHEDVLILSARSPLMPEMAWTLSTNEAIAAHDPQGNAVIIAAKLSCAQATAYVHGGDLPDACSIAVIEPADALLLTYPWDIVRCSKACIEEDLQSHTQEHLEHASEHDEEGVFIAPAANIDPGVVLDATNGPILIEDGVTIGANSVIQGPCAILQNAVISPRALIRAHTVIGPVCKVGGEIGSTIFQSYSNKVHDGYIGDSYVGEWVNLGAGTDSSNLLNTYGVIKATLQAQVGQASGLPTERISTGLNFFGCVLGDHSKAAIGTRIMTGSVWGTATMCAISSLPPTATNRFTWLSDKEPAGQAWAFEKFMEVASAAMARRKLEPSDAYTHRLKELAGEA